MQDQSPLEIIISFLLSPFRFFWGFVVFMVFAWTTSRNGRAFVFALPAMFFLVLFVAIVWAVGYKGSAKAYGMTFGRYSKVSNPTEANYNLDAALLYAKKIVAVEQESSSETKFLLGDCYGKLEDYDRALNVMASIAPDVEIDADREKLGFSPAYVWLADFYSEPTRSGLPEEECKVKRERYLRLAYAAEPTNVVAILGLAEMIWNQSRITENEAEELKTQGDTEAAAAREADSKRLLESAAKFLQQAISLPLTIETGGQQLRASTLLIDALQRLGREEEAARRARRFVGRYEGEFAARSADYLPLWISLIQVCIQIGDYERGDRLIRRGLELATNPQTRRGLQELIAQLQVEKSRSYEDMDDQQQFLERLYCLGYAAYVDFRFVGIYDEAIYYVDGFDRTDKKDFWLRDSKYGEVGLKSNEQKLAGAFIYILVGARDVLAGEKSAGQVEWENAQSQLRSTPYVLNNLIRRFTNARELDKSTRDLLLSAAIDTFPQEPELYATRAKFARDDKEFERALKDLEFARKRAPNPISMLEAMIVCHRELGNEEKIKQIQSEIDEIKAQKTDLPLLNSVTTETNN